MQISIIGSGAWGTAIAKVLAGKFKDNILLWSFEEGVKDSINNDHENVKYLKGIKLPDNLVASSDLLDIVSLSDYIFIATPSLYTLDILNKLRNMCFAKKPNLAILTKGFITIDEKPRTIVEVAESILNEYKNEITYISGPSHAEEVGLGIITGLVAASKSRVNAFKFIDLFSDTSISMFYSNDVLGVQIASALKNIFAIAFGILDEYKIKNPNLIGSNTESFLFSVSLSDMKNIACKIGTCSEETFFFLAGSGDLDVTCRSIFGRNRRFGSELVNKNILEGLTDIDDLIKNLHKIGYLPEGIFAAKEVSLLFRSLDNNSNYSNLANIVYKILNKELMPEAVIDYIRNFKV
ncbi:NAD(P)H-dependent glycerol-3-phosphate dehydrogenase [Borrelia miyamotoi]|uniref:Glycerol-3-phosphate dehydrogenase n=1 Tax=Borrelia miyamotoi TaxID=47466 RepID=A0AAQ3AGN0_9SPIR|nr:NAD(P)H-dependent glycerol-3-phosphate dehydrogenase [Borrelia miyamotoi]AGT27356.1 glycerol-3-phosphate dehydrogenase [Borrelia miyamotoi LB-2001]AJA58535.1 glycerol-3-phosphate dehydrogenase [Borrelia miyamotoi]AOW95612.1 glycerol-3-phosphate dehydrogenase [Borrelia miyamotoi]QTL83497.1 NAD(P)H-dependent glycerol-3-phosphate dehydrogenase [Borrelia miyamotoi]WAZ85208.1 NAD(P)H-dependent glycerol-3-phosphate dehydrogenase [Borrelia miyamotoi]